MADASYPDDLLYHAEHDWVRLEGGTAVFGITWFAQDALGEVVFFDPPEVGSTVTKDQSYAEVESVKAVSDVIAPLSGEIVEVNTDLGDKPGGDQRGPVRRGLDGAGQALRRGREGHPPRREGLRGQPLVSRYTSTTPEDLREMLAAIGVGSLEELFERQVPAGVRLGRALDLPAGLPEQDVYAHLRELAARNVSAEDEITFLGAGMYDHYVPAVVDMLMERSEYLTPYTPYQPEVSQGGAAGDVRVPDRDQRADGAAGLERERLRGPERRRRRRVPRPDRERQGPGRGLARRPPAQPRDAAHDRGRLRGRGGRGRPARRGHGPRRVGGRDRPGHERGHLPEPELPRRGRGRRGARARRRRTRRRSWSAPTTRCRSASSGRRASAASTSPWGRGNRWGTGSTSAGRRSATSPRPRRTCGACRAGSRARPATSTAAAASSSRCRRASSTSAARRRPRTSAPRRR